MRLRCLLSASRVSDSFTLLACNDQQRMSLFRKWRNMLQPIDAVNFPPPGLTPLSQPLLSFITRTPHTVFDDGSRKLTVAEMFSMSAVPRCIVQSFLKLPASNDEDSLLLLPSLFVGSAAQLRALLQVPQCFHRALRLPVLSLECSVPTLQTSV
jgi:hypothetical protein